MCSDLDADATQSLAHARVCRFMLERTEERASLLDVAKHIYKSSPAGGRQKMEL